MNKHSNTKSKKDFTPNRKRVIPAKVYPSLWSQGIGILKRALATGQVIGIIASFLCTFEYTNQCFAADLNPQKLDANKKSSISSQNEDPEDEDEQNLSTKSSPPAQQTAEAKFDLKSPKDPKQGQKSSPQNGDKNTPSKNQNTKIDPVRKPNSTNIPNPLPLQKPDLDRAVKYLLSPVQTPMAHTVSIKWAQSFWYPQPGFAQPKPIASKNQKRTLASQPQSPASLREIKVSGQILSLLEQPSEQPKDQVYQILVGENRAKTDTKGRFEVALYVSKDREVIPLQIIDPEGRIDTQIIEMSRDNPAANLSPWQFSIGGGYTTNHYFEKQSADLIQTSTTAKGSLGYQISPRWNFSLSGYVTAMPLTSTDSVAMRFLGINSRAGVSVLPLNWNLRLLFGFGFYLASAVTTDNSFGYQNISGPQIFPVIGYKIGPLVLNVYGKLSPVSAGGFSFLSSKSRELASGGSLVTKFPWLFKTIAFTYDYADLTINFQGLNVHSNSTSYGVSLGF